MSSSGSAGKCQNMSDLPLAKRRNLVQERLAEIHSLILSYASSYLSIKADHEIESSLQILHSQRLALQEILEDQDCLEE